MLNFQFYRPLYPDVLGPISTSPDGGLSDHSWRNLTLAIYNRFLNQNQTVPLPESNHSYFLYINFHVKDEACAARSRV